MSVCGSMSVYPMQNTTLTGNTPITNRTIQKPCYACISVAITKNINWNIWNILQNLLLVLMVFKT